MWWSITEGRWNIIFQSNPFYLESEYVKIATKQNFMLLMPFGGSTT